MTDRSRSHDMIAPSYLPRPATKSGRLLDLTKITLDDVDVLEIADTLAKINRFNGRTAYPYSVAQHAVLVSYLAPARLAYEALHHDDTEAFTGDIVFPIKRNIVWSEGGIDGAAFRKFSSFEQDLREVIAMKLKLARVEPHEVKSADVIACRMEQHFVQGWAAQGPDWGDVSVPPKLLREMSWREAAVCYLRRHIELGGDTW